jgi:hypothetical protein
VALQKQADQEKRATILQSEGHQQSAINVARVLRRRRCARHRANGKRRSCAPRATARRRSSSPRVAPRHRNRVQGDQGRRSRSDVGRHPPTRALAKFAESKNAKIVVPFESAGLLGAAQTLRSVLAASPTDGNEP